MRALGDEEEKAGGETSRRIPSNHAVLDRLLAIARNNFERLPANAKVGQSEPELTIVVLSHGRLPLTMDALRALRTHVAIPYRLLVVDNGSDDLTRSGLKQALGENQGSELVLLDRNLGSAAGRMCAIARVSTPFLMLLDNDITVLPGAVEHLLLALKSRDDAVAASGRIVFPDGTVHLCGGRLSLTDGVLVAELIEFGQPCDVPDEPSGVCDWVPGGMTVMKTDRLREVGYDARFNAYYEDLEWCLRLRRDYNGVFLRCAEALGIHYHEPKQPAFDLPLAERIPRALPFLELIGIVYREYGTLVPAIFSLVPEIGPASKMGLYAARLFLQLLNSYGAEWIARAWSAGELSPLFAAGASLPGWAFEQELSRCRAELAAKDAIIASRDAGIAWLRSELLEERARDADRKGDSPAKVDLPTRPEEPVTGKQGPDQLAALRMALSASERTLRLALGGCRRYETTFAEQLEQYRQQRAWKVMLWFRKAYVLFHGSGLLGKTRFLRFALSSLWKGASGLEESDLRFPELRNYLPREVLHLAAPADHAGVGGTVDRDAGGAGLLAPGKYDVIVLAIVDFDFRFQRPQQIAAQFAKSGHRVLWVSPTRFLPQDSPRSYEIQEIGEGLWEVRLRARHSDIYRGSLDDGAASELAECLRCVYRDFGIFENCVIVQIPFWRKVGLSLRRMFGATLLYDCMDEWDTFPDIGSFNISEERLLAAECDVLAVTAQNLAEKFSQRGLAPLLARNAADFDFFAAPPEGSLLPADIGSPVVGYFGAIADWVDLALVAGIAKARPRYSFVLIGEVFGQAARHLPTLPNLHLLGHRRYEDLPVYLRQFDACIIPFKLDRVTNAADPVKLYEYLSQGKPVVATDIAELRVCHDLLYVGNDSAHFASQLDRALQESDDSLKARRIEFARSNTWAHRVQLMDDAVRRAYPPVSVLVVTFNSAEFVGPCLDSIFHNTAYPNFEVIAVDNASVDETVQQIRRYAADPRLRLFCRAENSGFAGGNNFAAGRASGEYLVLLNADTMVTTGWLEILLRHLRRDPTVGLLTPVTNFAGNEIKIRADYRNQEEMETFAAYVTRTHFGESFDVEVAPLFCAITPKRVWERVGPLDETFEIGMFEDDDLAMRVRAAGFRVVAAPDCFIHHFGQGSFSKLPNVEYQRIFDRNRRAFEIKWGVTWRPHRLADGVRPAHEEERFDPATFMKSKRPAQ